jgi:general secretion pathway protein J
VTRTELAARGFTLVEVLIALAITAFVAAVAYTSLSTVITGVESARAGAERTQAINRTFMLLSRDLRQFVERPVRDEFGDTEPALSGGEAARSALSFTRAGWHNPNGLPRSHLQRVNYRFEDQALWRESYPVLDRAGDTEGTPVRLLDDVDYLELAFLGSVDQLRLGRGTNVDTRQWPENWVVDTSDPDALPSPPVAIEVTLGLADLGEITRLYVLPPL